MLFREESLVTKLLRDLLTEQFQSIRLDDEVEHRRVVSFVQRVMPSMVEPREAVHEGLSDLRRVRRPGRDRQGAPQQGLAQVRRLHRHQPDRSARRDRREHGPLRRQEVRRPARGHDRQDEPRSGARDRAPGAAARSGRDHRPRLHRHGGEEEPPEGAAGRRAGAAQGSGAVEGRAGVRLRADHHHAQAREEQPRAPADRAVSRTARARA